MEQRKFQRHSITQQQQIVFISGEQTTRHSHYHTELYPKKNNLIDGPRLSSSKNVLHYRVISKNVSATGFCFSSRVPFEIGSTLFASLKAQDVLELAVNRGNIIKAGNYFLSRVTRCQAYNDSSFYEIGCAFISRQQADPLVLDAFTFHLNRFTQPKSASLFT